MGTGPGSNQRGGERLAVITGASLGLGAALAEGLAAGGWRLLVDARSADALDGTTGRLRRAGASVTSVAGDVADPGHRDALAAVVRDHGRLDLLVNNASVLGPSPQPGLDVYDLAVLRRVYEVNVFAPVALTQLLVPWLRVSPDPRVVNVTSDAAVEAYEGWGGYGSSKAALEQITAVWAAEAPWARWWAVDPGDMRTRMHQEAFPGEDISDRPEPSTVVPAILSLIDSDRASGRVRVADLLAGVAAPDGGRP
jgi:NAD(P)-dependent dehydrogenase (short-subunit alcohol dehydrogenase family)